MTPHKPIHPRLAKKRNRQLRAKLISVGLFAFSTLTRGPTLLWLLVRSRLEPANAPEAHAPDVYSLGIMLLLMDFIGHAGHVGTTFRHPPSGDDDDRWRQDDVSSSSNILLTTSAVAWLSLSVLLAAMAPYADRDRLFWLAVAFQIAAGFASPAAVAVWRNRRGLRRLAGRCCASGAARRRARRTRRKQRAVEEGAAADEAAGETAPGEVVLGKLVDREGAAGEAAAAEAAAAEAPDREIAAPAPAALRWADSREGT
ncbi:hypothetical protein MCOR27_008817 [Pyricularia oryzae]|uniref:Uncharacterized protein n=1 Tax=Pyricularia oryzae TaxID=318829 RepID=A0A4P7N1D6_PYROR|nr:hypothetical protein MCOR27_008817 [Pyricularia oryzae]KAI6304668.1 hypothetical protein MCOR34_008772 [Pyricularia oryzae]KAI6319884.1 hypothetical protein MCOR29_005465 [Pyricularia oryzae]KAI6382549.1 hypothetical protein MCOR32_003038 [Pyricularia oryzae]KAI6398936.1 hypothetical protein MCOR24_008779 [Pyricularia oryzae]